MSVVWQEALVINKDHAEEDLGQLAGVSDRGLRHPRNEDAFHLAVAPTADGPVAEIGRASCRERV